MSADYKTEPKKNIDEEWEANRTKAQNILEAIKVALNSPATTVNMDLPGDLDNPESQTEVDAVNEFAQHGYDQACELANIFDNMGVGDQVQKCLDNIMDEMGETEGDQARMRECGMDNGDF